MNDSPFHEHYKELSGTVALEILENSEHRADLLSVSGIPEELMRRAILFVSKNSLVEAWAVSIDSSTFRTLCEYSVSAVVKRIEEIREELIRGEK